MNSYPINRIPGACIEQDDRGELVIVWPSGLREPIGRAMIVSKAEYNSIVRTRAMVNNGEA